MLNRAGLSILRIAPCLVLGVLSACAEPRANGVRPATIAASSPSRSAPYNSAAPGPVAAGLIQRVVVVSVDGMMPDTYLHPDAHGLRVPTLRWLVQHGAVSSGVRSVFPTLTYPAHTSMVTGVNPGIHGIVGNASFDPLENDWDSWRWYAEDIRTEPIWSIAQRAGYDTALVHWPVTLGARVKWLVPEFWRAKNVQDQKLLRAVSTPSLLDEVDRASPGFWQRFVPPQVSDDLLTDIAVYLLKHERPRLLFLHLVGVDGAQHRHGIDSAEANAAIELDDQQLARIFQALATTGDGRETAVLVVSDHGFRAAPRQVRPCTLLERAGLVSSDEHGKTTGWKAWLLANAGSAYVYLKDPADVGSREVVQAIFARARRSPDSGIGRVYQASEIRALGGDPAALLALEASSDFQFGSGCTGEYEAHPSYVATHGFDPERPEMRASLLMTGPGIAHGTVADARLIDIAPTIAQWLRLPLTSREGAPLQVRVAP